MAGCYGNSAEDRYFESICDKHTNECDSEDCNCEVHYSEEKNDYLLIGGVETSRKEIEDNDYYCPECGEKFDLDSWY